jgi:hypothetical protein
MWLALHSHYIYVVVSRFKLGQRWSCRGTLLDQVDDDDLAAYHISLLNHFLSRLFKVTCKLQKDFNFKLTIANIGSGSAICSLKSALQLLI